MYDSPQGWIRLHRGVESHWIWEDPVKLKWWLWLLFMANWEDKKVIVGSTIVVVKRGQLIASNKYLMDKWGVCTHTVRNFLRLLETDDMITQTAYPKYNVITICNYDKYIDENSNEKPSSFDYNESHYVPVRHTQYHKNDDLYLIRDSVTNYLKIGRSYNPDKRIKQLQTGHAGTLTMLYTLKGKGHLEKKFHKKFQNLNTSGEWFIDDGSIISEYRRFLKNENCNF
jgi:hypothetical protein